MSPEFLFASIICAHVYVGRYIENIRINKNIQIYIKYTKRMMLDALFDISANDSTICII